MLAGSIAKGFQLNVLCIHIGNILSCTKLDKGSTLPSCQKINESWLESLGHYHYPSLLPVTSISHVPLYSQMHQLVLAVTKVLNCGRNRNCSYVAILNIVENCGQMWSMLPQLHPHTVWKLLKLRYCGRNHGYGPQFKIMAVLVTMNSLA